MRYQLPLALTHELSDIYEQRDWDALEEFIAQYGFDENEAELEAIQQSKG